MTAPGNFVRAETGPFNLSLESIIKYLFYDFICSWLTIVAEEKIEQETIEQKQPEINENKGDSELRKMAIPAEPNEIKTEKKLNNNNFIPGKKKREKTRLKLK